MNDSARRTLGVLLVSVVAACSQKAGDPCTKGTAACLNHDTQLSCNDGKYIETPCRGPKGCRTEGTKLLCDVTKNKEGDVCSSDDEKEGACSSDGKTLVVCEKGTYRVKPCLGPEGCKEKGTNFTCDRSIDAEGNACSSEGDHACTTDGKRMLTCKDGKFTPTLDCGGPKGCNVGDKINCDESIGAVGSLCDEGAGCSADGKQMLLCKAGKMALMRLCRGSAGCKAEGSKVGCAEMGIAEAGDVCEGDVGACSEAHDAFLECKDGKFTVTQKCACEIDGTRVSCK